MGGNYTGNYCVQLELWYYSNLVCTASNCRITGTGCWSFACDFGPLTTTKGYWVKVINAARTPSGNCATSGQISGYNYWDEMICSSCNCQLTIYF